MILLTEGQEIAGDSVYGRRITMIEIESGQKLDELLAKRSLGYDFTFPMVKEPVTFTSSLEASLVNKLPLFDLEDPFLHVGRSAPIHTQVRFGQTDSYLYLLAKVTTPEKHESTLEKDDPGIRRDDTVEFLVEPTRGTRYLVAVNSSGTLLDARLDSNDTPDPSWDSKAEVIVAPIEAGWDL